MTDVSTPTNVSAPSSVQDRVAAIRADIAARAAEAAKALQSDVDRCSALDAAKKVCADACGAVHEALAEAGDPAERGALIELEAETHSAHAKELEAAFLSFASQREGDSSPATPGGVTPINADVVVTAASAGEVSAPEGA